MEELREKILTYVIEHLDMLDCKEMGALIDMIKDLSEAMYYDRKN